MFGFRNENKCVVDEIGIFQKGMFHKVCPNNAFNELVWEGLGTNISRTSCYLYGQCCQHFTVCGKCHVYLCRDINIIARLFYVLVEMKIEPVHEISNNVVCATSQASDQPAHTRSLIRAFTSRLSILLLLSR